MQRVLTPDQAKLEEIIQNCTNIEYNESMENAIESLIRADFTDLAFLFADRFKNHELAVKILTDNSNDVTRAIEYLSKQEVFIQIRNG